MSGSCTDEGITARSRAKPVALEKRGKEGGGGGGGGGARGTAVTERKASESRPVCVLHMEKAMELYCGVRTRRNEIRRAKAKSK